MSDNNPELPIVPRSSLYKDASAARVAYALDTNDSDELSPDDVVAALINAMRRIHVLEGELTMLRAQMGTLAVNLDKLNEKGEF